jgi:FAD/FMN-containing dehydrogenase/Fe-S oxidoreductase
MTCHVEAGVGIDQLNGHLASSGTGLFFSPDPATVAQATIGGCIGNNAAGARSIRYGRTSENVSGVDVVLGDGRRIWLEPMAGRRDAEAGRVAVEVARIVSGVAGAVRERYPRLVRRNAGYGLDMVLAQLDRGVAAEDLDLSGLICGSEGTLAMVVGAKLKLRRLPIERGLAIVAFENVQEAIAAVPGIVESNPTAVELLDDVVLRAAAGNAQCRGYLDVIPACADERPAGAVLYVEYTAENHAGEIGEGFARLAKIVPGGSVRVMADASSRARAWALRKAGEPLLHGISAGRKPQTFVEDNSVPIENLGRFVAEFRKIVDRHGTSAAYWAHASVGVLHIRPLIDLHDPADRQRMREIAVEVAELARACGGVMSGEHGDGKVRGPLLERFFGPEIVRAFARIKSVFDPAGILNPGNIVGAGAIETITERLRVLPVDREVRVAAVATHYEYGDAHGFGGAVEMCNGAGFCRKMQGGTMCPSYRATLDERHSPRGRANAIRLAMTGQLGTTADAGPLWNDAETQATLDLCLSCKACKTECPSNVDIARLKSEYLAQSYRAAGRVPMASWLVSRIRWLNRAGALWPTAANFVQDMGPMRWAMRRLMGVDRRRSLPRFDRSLGSWMHGREARGKSTRPRVAFFADCFTGYGESRIGRQCVELLETLGYEVIVPATGCCGRTGMSCGCLDEARKAADATAAVLGQLASSGDVRAILFAEPSCLSAVVDDWLDLRLSADKSVLRGVAGMAMTVEDFVEAHWDRHPRPPVIRKKVDGPVIVHGHCHQKALWGTNRTASLLGRVAGSGSVNVLDSGCCGMAGWFGFTEDHYDVSMRIGEAAVLPAARAMGSGGVMVACGTSCRHQIRDGTGGDAVHPVEVLWRAMGLGGGEQ